MKKKINSCMHDVQMLVHTFLEPVIDVLNSRVLVKLEVVMSGGVGVATTSHGNLGIASFNLADVMTGLDAVGGRVVAWDGW